MKILNIALPVQLSELAMENFEFKLLENRLKLLFCLKESGFYVRMHAYEYLIGYNGKLIGLILLEPRFNRVILNFFEKIDTKILVSILTCIRKISPQINIEEIAERK